MFFRNFEFLKICSHGPDEAVFLRLYYLNKAKKQKYASILINLASKHRKLDHKIQLKRYITKLFTLFRQSEL